MCKGTGLASERVGKWGIEEDTHPRERNEREADWSDDLNGPTERVPLRDWSLATTTTEPDINGVAWRLGWHPFKVVIGLTILTVLLLSVFGAEGVVSGFVLGVPVGLAVWYWGSREISTNYEPYVREFLSETKRKAERGIQAADVVTYLQLSGSGGSPPLTEAYETYYTTAITLTDVSVIVNRDAAYDLRSLELASGGSSHEVFFERISTVDAYHEDEISALEIWTFEGNRIVVSPLDADTASVVLSELRQRIRQGVRGTAIPSSGLVVDDVYEEAGDRYVVLRNASDEAVDLSEASITDGSGNRFQFAEGFSLAPDEVERFRVHDSFAPDADERLTLTTRSGDEYEIRR